MSNPWPEYKVIPRRPRSDHTYLECSNIWDTKTITPSTNDLTFSTRSFPTIAGCLAYNSAESVLFLCFLVNSTV